MTHFNSVNFFHFCLKNSFSNSFKSRRNSANLICFIEKHIFINRRYDYFFSNFILIHYHIHLLCII
nr:MAG TPA: hypothetical protein [Caudoviricetes sp.]